MHTRRLDATLTALAGCRTHIPGLRDLYRPGSPQRAALETLLEAVERADQIVFGRKPPP